MFNLYCRPRALRSSKFITCLVKQKFQSSYSTQGNEKSKGHSNMIEVTKALPQVRTYSKATASIKKLIMCPVQAHPSKSSGNKITIIGGGRAGMSCAMSILCKGVTNEICIIDSDKQKAECEALDLMHAAAVMNDAQITGGCDYNLSRKSLIYIICFGGSGKKSLSKNAEMLSDVVPQIAQASPDSIILMVSEPVDIMSYLAWKLSKFPLNRVLGVGTTLDTTRFRYLISKKLNIAPSSCDAYIIGEHGPSSVPVWSGVNVSGAKFIDLDESVGYKENDAEGWSKLHQKVIDAEKDIIKVKGSANWAIGLTTAYLVDCILKNTGAVTPVCTSVKGLYGIEDDIFMSLPCSLHANGVSNVIVLNLYPNEEDKLQASAKVLVKAHKELSL